MKGLSLMSTVFITTNRNGSYTFKLDDIKSTFYGCSITTAKKLFRQNNGLVGKHIQFITI